MVKERPILFSASMVKAILENRKFQTRRVVKPQPEGSPYWTFHEDGAFYPANFQAKPSFLVCPYGVPGDRLWVRETHYRWTGCNESPSDWVQSPDKGTYQSRGYVGTPEHDDLYERSAAAIKVPSIHMPRWASRITLEVTGTRVERLHHISEKDAKAEGAMYHDGQGVGHSGWRHDSKDVHANARSSFARLWSEINGSESWDSNPFVWVVEFKEGKTPCTL